MLNVELSLFSLIAADLFPQIFTESLLCSSRLENIQLAGQMMHCAASPVPAATAAAAKGRAPYRVSYQKSVDLVLAASREYFNSSTNLTDSCMGLARWVHALILPASNSAPGEVDTVFVAGM